MKIRSFVLLCIILTSNAGFSQDIEKAVFDFQQLASLKHAAWGLKVKNLSDERIMMDVNSDQSLIPASTLKLITTGMALQILGPDYRFKTILAYRGSIENGVLEGDLVILGGGDPTFGYPDFQKENPLDSWIDKLQEFKIDSISGNIIADISRYREPLLPPTWVYQDLGNYYGAAPSALTFINNQFQITFAQGAEKGDETRILEPEKSLNGLSLINEVLAGKRGTGDNAYVYGCPGCESYAVRGTIPPGLGTFSIKASIPDPPAYLLNSFTKKLEKVSIGFDKTHVSKEGIENLKSLDIHFSVHLREILREINENSNNLYAEHLRLELMKKEKKEWKELVHSFYDKHGLSNDGLFIEDASGLSRYNALSINCQLDFLEMMHDSEFFKDYLSSFAVGGESGTVKYMFKSDKGTKYYVKSGTLSRVKAYSGYALKDEGDIIAFSISVNNFSGKSSEMTAQIEKLLMEIIQ